MIPHLAVPFRILGDRAVTVDQDTIAEIRQNVEVLVSTFQGERPVVPEYGISDPTFSLEPGDDELEDIIGAIRRWEPRAEVTGEVASLKSGERHMTIYVGVGAEA